MVKHGTIAAQQKYLEDLFDYKNEIKKYDDKLEELFEKQYQAMIYDRNKELGKLDILQAKLEKAKEDLRLDRDVALGIRKPRTNLLGFPVSSKRTTSLIHGTY